MVVPAVLKVLKVLKVSSVGSFFIDKAVLQHVSEEYSRLNAYESQFQPCL